MHKTNLPSCRSRSRNLRLFIASLFFLSVPLSLARAACQDFDHPRAYPNPLQLYKGQNAMTFTNVRQCATVKIYTYAGELVRSLPSDSSCDAVWDAKNSDGDLVASGVYLALVECDKTSDKNLRTVKVAVER